MELMECWEEEGEHISDLECWVKERSQKGNRGMMSLHAAHVEIDDKSNKRGYVSAPKGKRDRESRMSTWDSSTNAIGVISNYNTHTDKHCKGLISSSSFKIHTRKQIYAAEVNKAQKRFGSFPGTDIPIQQAADEYVAQPPKKKSTSLLYSSQMASKKALKALQLRKHARDQAGEGLHLPSMRVPESDSDTPREQRRENPADAAASRQTIQKVMQPYNNTHKRAKPNKRCASFKRKRSNAAKPTLPTPPVLVSDNEPNITINNNNTSKTYHQTIHNYLGCDKSETTVRSKLLQKIESLEDEKTTLQESIDKERIQKQAMVERLNNEIQKKVKSTKQASSKDERVKELQTVVTNTQVENERLRERCKQAETKADRFTSVDRERRRSTLALQQKEVLYHDLQSLLNKAEERLHQYELSGVEARSRSNSNLDKEHLRIRLQQEIKTRTQVEKKLEQQDLELSSLKQENLRFSRQQTLTNKKHQVQEANGNAELVQCQKERELVFFELHELKEMYEADKQAWSKQVNNNARKEIHLSRKLEEREDTIRRGNEELHRKTDTLEAHTREQRRETGDAKLAIARLELELKSQVKIRNKFDIEKTKLEETISSMKEELNRYKKRNQEVDKDIAAQQVDFTNELQQAEEATRNKQLSWERNRSELIIQVNKMSIREQELVAEARMHLESHEQTKKQLSLLQTQSNMRSDKSHFDANEKLQCLQEQYNSLVSKHKMLLEERSISQKVCLLLFFIVIFLF